MAFLIFLGTGDADGIPAIGCLCDHCKLARENRALQRSWASLFISDGLTNILVDPTPALRDQFIRVGIDKDVIHAVLITHWHFEHWIGVVELHAWDRKGLSKYSPKFEVFMNEYALSQYEKVLPALVDSTNIWLKTRYEFHVVRSYNPFKIGEIKVIPVELDHSLPSTGFIFKLKNRYVAYLVDSGPDLSKQAVDIIKKHADILILDNTWEKSEGSGHMDIVQAVEFVKNIKPKMAFATHIGHKNLPHDKLDKILRNKTDGVLRAAYDGLRIEFSRGEIV